MGLSQARTLASREASVGWRGTRSEGDGGRISPTPGLRCCLTLRAWGPKPPHTWATGVEVLGLPCNFAAHGLLNAWPQQARPRPWPPPCALGPACSVLPRADVGRDLLFVQNTCTVTPLINNLTKVSFSAISCLLSSGSASGLALHQ